MDGAPRGWLYNGAFYEDDAGGTISAAGLQGLVASEGPITYTCAPPGSGQRMGLDRDLDLVLDGTDNCDEIDDPDQLDTDGDLAGNLCDADDDDDGLADDVETNTGEFVSPQNTGTNPLLADSDLDGFDDGVEVLAGTDPNDAQSTPTVPPVPILDAAGLALLGVVLAGAGLRVSWRRLARESHH